MGQHSKRTRRKLFIDPVVQGAILRRLALHWLCTLLTAFVCLLMVHVFTAGVDLPFREQMRQMWERYGLFFIALLFTLPAYAYDSVKLSHRFAGPAFAIRMTLRKLADGHDIPEITFRKGDFWTDIAVDINRIAQRLRTESGKATAPVKSTPNGGRDAGQTETANSPRSRT
jgi:hypothetical protein